MCTAFYQRSVVSFLAACGDLITAVFDFAHGICALKLTEHQIALFSALVLINAGKTNSSYFTALKEHYTCCSPTLVNGRYFLITSA